MSEKNYSERGILDKLGIQPGDAVAISGNAWEIDSELIQHIIERTGRPLATTDEVLDSVLVTIDEAADAVEVLRQWRPRLSPNGGIWLLTVKRGQPGYVDQRALIAAGQQAEVVDHKVCSVSPTISAMRFVIRKKDRQDGRPENQ